MFFLLDQSESVGLDNFKLIMEFGKLFANSFTLSLDNVQMGVATFGTRVYPKFHLGALNTINEVEYNLDIIPYTGG